MSKRGPGGVRVKRIHVTNEAPRRISAIDIATVVTKKDANHAAQDIGFAKEKYPDVTQILGDFQFRGQGQRKTPVMLEVRDFFTDLGLPDFVGDLPQSKQTSYQTKQIL